MRNSEALAMGTTSSAPRLPRQDGHERPADRLRGSSNAEWIADLLRHGLLRRVARVLGGLQHQARRGHPDGRRLDDHRDRGAAPPFEPQLATLTSIPGVGRRTAETVLAEVGADVSRFLSARHLASWAGLAPGNDESAGKRRSGRTRKGSPWLRSALVESSFVASRTKTYLAAQFRRVAARRGGKRAAVAVAHSIMVIAYQLLSRQTTYADLGANYFGERDREHVRRRRVRRLDALGYAVEVSSAA